MMMMMGVRKIAIVVVVLGVLMFVSNIELGENGVEASEYPCNPASHCADRSQLCVSSKEVEEIVANELEGVSTVEEENPSFEQNSRGICTDAFRWICNREGTACRRESYTREQLNERCRNILFTDRSLRHRFSPNLFREACDAGFYTCNDGSCAERASGCNGAPGGVRYDKQRCEINTCTSEFVLNNKCSFEKQQQQQQQGSKQTATEKETELQSNLQCSGNWKTSLESCCTDDQGPACEFLRFTTTGIDLENPAETGACSPEQCPRPHPYWYQPGESGRQSRSSLTGGTSFREAEADTAEADHELTQEIVGVELSWKVDKKSQESSCCCRLSCDCFGDPHCTDFFGQPQVTKIPGGSFSMLSMGDFSYDVDMGAPQGIIINAIFATSETSGKRLSLSNEHCNNETHNWIDADTGEFLSRDELPASWTMRFTQGDPFTDPSTHIVRDTKVGVLVELRCVRFTYIHNLRNRNLIAGTRIDTTVTDWQPTGSDGCCPTEDERKAFFEANDASGYCPQTEDLPQSINRRTLSESRKTPDGAVADDSTFHNKFHSKFHSTQAKKQKQKQQKTSSLPNEFKSATELKAYDAATRTGNRRVLNQDSTKETKDEIVRGALDNGKAKSKDLNDDTVEKLCELYLKLIEDSGVSAIAALSEREKCIDNTLDFGVTSLQQLIHRLQGAGSSQCIVDINDKRLLRPFDACENGFTLQVKSPSDDKFRDWRFFRANDAFCDDKIFIDFSRAYDVKEDSFLSRDYEFRIRRCSPDPDICGKCEPVLAFQDIQFRYMFGCNNYNQYKLFTQQNLFRAFQNGVLSCGFRHSKQSDPLSCLKLRFPEAFGVLDPENWEGDDVPLLISNPDDDDQAQATTSQVDNGEDGGESGLPSRPCRTIQRRWNCKRYPWCQWKGHRCISGN